MTFLRRELTRTAGLLALVGCAHAADVSGRPPDRIPRELGDDHPRPPLDRKAAYEAQTARAAEAGAGPKVEAVDPALARVGVASTHVFHRAGCALLKDVTPEDKLRFTSPWEALDGGFRPCPKCRALE